MGTYDGEVQRLFVDGVLDTEARVTGGAISYAKQHTLAAGTYVDAETNACMPCAANCHTCNGPGGDACITCPAAGTPYLDVTTCVAQCPNPGKFGNENMTCVTCDAGCLACDGDDSASCTSCHEGAELLETGVCQALTMDMCYWDGGVPWACAVWA